MCGVDISSLHGDVLLRKQKKKKRDAMFCPCSGLEQKNIDDNLEKTLCASICILL